MKRLAPLGGVVAALLLIGVAANAATIQKPKDITATVTSSASLVADVYLNSDGTTGSTLGFGSQSAGVSSWSTVAAQHVKIQVFNNSAAWTLKAYTKNFDVAPSTSDWGYSYGGLIGSTTSAKIPLAWRASTTTATAAPAFGDPSVSSTTATFGWTFFKDYWDADDPGQADDQSFAAAQGYITVAYGSAGGTNVVAKKQNVTTASALATPTSVFRLYLEGNFAGAPAGTYNQTAPPGGASKNKLQLDLDYN